MKTKRTRPIANLALGIVVMVCTGGLTVESQVVADQRHQPKREADNSGVNERDWKAETTTADDSSMSATDAKLAARIRKSILQDDTLSTYAHNVKIISENGFVTLRGPVRSEAEREIVAKKAGAIAGVPHVRNELEIAPKG